MKTILNRQSNSFRLGYDLLDEDAEAFFDALIAENDDRMLIEVFRAWNLKGIHSDEIYSLARVMRNRCRAIDSRHRSFVDLVGTGGSRAKTFNVSTAAAFVAAGAGVPVAKHGNRAATSNSGSSDVLAELGIDPDSGPASAERCLNEIGICFMFAPNYHRLSPTLAQVRRQLGFPTIFNSLGPLCNPATAPHQLIGVYEISLIERAAQALARLGTARSWVVHGDCGLDEIVLDGNTSVAEIDGRSVRTLEISPADFGIEPAKHDEINVSSPAESAAMIVAVLRNALTGRPAESLVAINAAAAIYLAGHANDLRTAADAAFESIRSGKALFKLNQLAEASGR